MAEEKKHRGMLPKKRIEVFFFQTSMGREPVRQWLKSLQPSEDRQRIGLDIMAIEFGWPIGMPICRSLGDGLYEVRSDLTSNRIARIIFHVDPVGRMVLLHGFIKKTPKTPPADLEQARRNRQLYEASRKAADRNE